MRLELWVYMERVEPAGLGLLCRLKSMGGDIEKAVTAILPENCDPAPVFACGAQKIYRLIGKGDERQTAGQIAALCTEHAPNVLVFLATVSCRNIAAMVAAELETGLSADCTDIELRSGNILVQTRPAFGGLMFADIVCTNRRPQMATVRPGIFLMGPGNFPETGEIIDVPESLLEAHTNLLQIIKTGQQSLPAARIVLSGGKGIKSSAGMQHLQKLAALTGAAVAASRGAVSAGFAQYGWQVGLTGLTIRPDVYIAFGISGAVQHLVGIEGAKTIIAVNPDRNAPIFEYADIGIVSDWEPVIEKLIETIQN